MIGSLFSLIPAPYRLLALLALAAALVGYGWANGAAHVQDEWDAAVTKENAHIAAVRTRQAEATVRVVTEYVDRVQVVRERGETIVKEVLRYVPRSDCALSGGFRVLHDAAASGTNPDPARIADAPPAAAPDVASTVSVNYTACHQNAEQLIALQAWVAGMRAAGYRAD